MPVTRERREKSEAIVREHMETENEPDYEVAIATSDHPRYELIGGPTSTAATGGGP